MLKPDEKLDDEGRELATAMGVEGQSPEVEPGEEGASKSTPSKAPGIEDEVRKLREDFDSSRQDMASRIDQLTNENAFYRARLEEQRPREVSREEVEKEEALPISEEDYYKNPVKGSMVIAEYTLKKQVAKAQEAQGKRYEVEMRSAYERGRDNAFKKWPELFKGIEGEVENIMYNSYKERRITNPREMEEEGNWAFAGEIMHRAKGELNFEKYYRSNPGATDAGFSEVPSAGRARGRTTAAPEWDAEADILLDEINRGEKKPITKEEVNSMVMAPPKSKRR